MKKKYGKYLLISIIFLVVVFSISVYVYISQINIYRELTIQVFYQNQNLTQEFKCVGNTVFNKNVDVLEEDSIIYIPKGTYLKNFKIYPANVSVQNKQYSLKIFQSNRVVVDTLFNDTILINYVPQNNSVLNSKIEILSLLYQFNQKYIYWVLYFFLIILATFYFIKKYDYFNRIILIVLCVSTSIVVYHLVYLETQRVWTGLYIQISLFSLIILLINFLMRNIANKQKDVITVFSSTFLTIIGIEIILRIFGINSTYLEKRESYYLSPDEQYKIHDYHTNKANSIHYLQSEEFKYERKTNSLGFSDIEFVKDTSSSMILALGDSFTEGDGAPYDSTWVKQLELKIVKNDTNKYIVYNAGVCGSDPFYEYKLLKDKLLYYNPRTVIVAYGYDLDDVIMRGGVERFAKSELVIATNWWEKIYRHSYICRLIVHNLLGYNYLLLSELEYESGKERAVYQLQKSIDLFLELSENENFELLIVFYPLKEELIEDAYFYNNILIDYCSKKNINNLDLLEYYSNTIKINSDTASNYYWNIDGHHNSIGYEIFASGVYEKLKKMGY